MIGQEVELIAVDHDQIGRSLERLGEAMGAGDPAAVARRWELPGLVISDEGTAPVTDRGQLEGFFAQAIGAYNIQVALTMTASS